MFRTPLQMAVPSNIAVYKGIGGEFGQSKLVCWSQPGLMAGFRRVLGGHYKNVVRT